MRYVLRQTRRNLSQSVWQLQPDSDVDLLVEFLPDARPTLLDMAEIERELSELLDGATGDLRTAQDLSRYFRDEVVKEAELQYAAG
jgi:predicted nucleotidyltransferase